MTRRVRELYRGIGIHGFGIGILICSILAPVALERASVWSSRASDADQRTLQSEALHVEFFLKSLGSTSADARVFGGFDQAAGDAGALDRQAKELARRAPRLASRLAADAQEERSIAAGLRQSARSNIFSWEQQHPSFSFAHAEQVTDENALEAAGVQPTGDRHSAKVAHDKATDYDGIAMLWTIGLFFFTLAYVARARARPTFALSGSLVVLATGVLWLVLWLS